jgi:putative SOS response-associated peptidase YedK
MAGLWETWVDAQNDACLHTFCVVTTVACKRLQPFASGMPVIVAPGQRTTYLNTGVPLQRVTRMLRPLETDQINLYPVSPAINDRTADNRDLLQPVGQRIYKEFAYRRRMLLKLEGMGSGKENHGHGHVAGNIL